MEARKVSESVYCIHADINNNDRFEGIWLMPNGVSINSYIVKGEKNALIDVVKDWDNSLEAYREQLKSLGLKFSDFDYVILNHLEPDHADLIELVLKESPNAEIISTAKGIAMAENFFKTKGKFRAVKDGDILDLGAGKILTFYETPNIHWPETMMTYETSEKILFSCDAFGSYGCINENIFDEQRSGEELQFFENEALRYYANIVSSFSSFVERGIKKLESLDIKIVCPSHGLVWKKNAGRIINLYKRLAGYNTGKSCEKEICIIWGSMYGYTKSGLNCVICGIEEEGIPYSLHKLPDDDSGFILGCALKSSAVVIAMPTYEYKMFPPMAHMLDLFERKHITGKTALRVGNWGWSGGAEKEYRERAERLKWNCLETCEWRGKLSEEDKIRLKESGRNLAKFVKAQS